MNVANEHTSLSASDAGLSEWAGGTPIHYAEEARFHVPKLPVFGYGASLLSVLSLCLMTVLAWTFYAQLRHSEAGSWLAPPAEAGQAAWTWLPFAFTLFGAGLGALFEIGLMLAGTPFQTARNRFTRFIGSVRLLNLAPVVGTILFFVCSVLVTEPSLRVALLIVIVLIATGLAFALFFGGAEIESGFIIMSIQLVQILMLLIWSAAVGANAVNWILIGQAGLQIAALLIGTATPLRSTGFHLLSTGSMVLLYWAICTITQISPNYSHEVAVAIPLWSLLFWSLLAAGAAGIYAISTAFPMPANRLRAIVSNLVWSVPNFLLVSNPRFPNPKKLNEVYQGKAPPPIGVRPYFQEHPEFLVQSLSVSEAMALPKTVTALTELVEQAKKIFKLLAPLDHFFPQANIGTSINNKPRMAVWSDGQDYWPGLFRKTVFGRSVPQNGELERAPEPAIAAFKIGQLLAYLAESGIGSTLVKRVDDHPTATLMLDFRFLQGYETKTDYASYGGVAYFRIDTEAKQLVLVSVVAPHSTEELTANPKDPSFRFAESQILASLYYYVVSGKHLVEIHMSYALVEVALHNAFDSRGEWTHPFRTCLYLHLFAHGLAETLTTEHLVQEGAVFAQIFATTQNGLIHHLNDCFTHFRYGDDEDFELRKTLLAIDGEPLPKAAITWEVAYAEIWQRYTTAIIDAVYANDAAVQADGGLQDFHRALSALLLKGLPARYHGFQTKAGVARYAADTIHHLVVRHQVYGTTSVKAALDPRISKTQVPNDNGPTPVDEWRSLASVALATERARFTLLLGDFKYLFDDVDDRYREPMRRAFDQLQHDLKELDRRWTSTEADKQFNYDYFRPIPTELHTGAGY